MNKILFYKFGNDLNGSLEKTQLAISKINKETNSNLNSNLAIGFMSTSHQPEYEESDFIQGKFHFLSGKSMSEALDRIDEIAIAPIVCFIIDPKQGYNFVNLCYNMFNKYGVVCCSVINDKDLEHYIYHEIVHAIHLSLIRKNIILPDSQDEEVLKIGKDASTPEHQAIVKKNLEDCLPYIDKAFAPPLEGMLVFKKQNLLVLLLAKLVELLKLLPRKKDKTYYVNYATEMAKKYGVDDKVMVATIGAESGFDPNAYNENKNGTLDYGICQINTHWFIGSNSQAALKDEYYFPSPEYVINNPKICIEGMAQQGQKGRQNDWIAYKSGAYKEYM